MRYWLTGNIPCRREAALKALQQCNEPTVSVSANGLRVFLHPRMTAGGPRCWWSAYAWPDEPDRVVIDLQPLDGAPEDRLRIAEQACTRFGRVQVSGRTVRV